MKSVIAFRDGRRANLAAAVSTELYTELEGTQGHSKRKDPLLFCGGCGGGLYVRHGTARRDELFGAHFDAGTCAEDLTIHRSAMSDEHKRMAEYHVLAARAQGLDADMEVTTAARTRVDVVVDGRIGIEVQLSALTAGAAVRRTARSIAGGLEAVAWCAESTSARWTGKVPGYQWLDNGQVLQGMPPPRSVRSRGLLTFRAVRSRRGTWVPVPEPLTVVVDEAVVRMAEGSVRPVMVGKFVQLVTADGISLYEDMTGRKLAPFTGTAPVRALSPAGEAKCLRPTVRAAADTADAEIRPLPAALYAEGWPDAIPEGWGEWSA